MTKQTYVPILKWKAGEKKAIKNLHSDQQDLIKPLFEIVDDYSPVELVNDVSSYWKNEFYYDTSYSDSGDNSQLVNLVKEIGDKGIKGIPVLGEELSEELITKLSDHTNKIAFRINVPSDFESPEPHEIVQSIDELGSKLGFTADLVFDLGLVDNNKEASRSLREMKDIVRTIPVDAPTIDNVVMSLTSFPDKFDNMDATNEMRCERFEYRMWKKLSDHSDFPIVYSDYGVTKFTDSEIDFSKLKYGVLPKAKYTTPTEYWIIKGSKDRKTRETTKGFREIAKQICESSDYCGKSFSFGDLDIFERANCLNGKGCGNSTNWVTICANHHISLVLEQLSK